MPRFVGGVDWSILQRKAQDDAAIDRAGFQLQREAFVVLVRPCCADFVPVGIVAFFGDVPG